MSLFTTRIGTRVVARSVGTVTAAGILSLLAAFPALAVGEPFFTVTFDPDTGAQSSNDSPTGVTGSATFTFFEVIGQPNQVDMRIDLSNTSTNPPFTSTRFVALAFQLPTEIFTVPANPPAPPKSNEGILSNGYTVGTGLGGLNEVSRFDLALANIDLNPFDPSTSSPPDIYSLCITAQTDCQGGGSPDDGLQNQTLNYNAGSFLLSSTSYSSATGFRDAFVNYYGSNIPSNTNNIGPVAARFKGIEPGGDSEKLLAGTIVPGPDQSPGNEVPGPLPLFGAAAAFSYSRKLRQRVKTKTLIG